MAYVYMHVHVLMSFIASNLNPKFSHVLCIEHSVCLDKEWPRCITVFIIFLNSQQHPFPILLVVATFLNKYFPIQFIFANTFARSRQQQLLSLYHPLLHNHFPVPPGSTKIQTHTLPNTHIPLERLVTR